MSTIGRYRAARRARTVALVLVSLFGSQPALATDAEYQQKPDPLHPDEPNEPFPTPTGTPERRAAFIAETVQRMNTSDGPFRVVDVIWDMPAAYGAFADLDADGDLDYIATEMGHRREMVTTFLRNEDGWQAASRISDPIRARHPMTPWVLPDDGSGNPALIIPTGWAPYLTLVPTDGRGRMVKQAVRPLKKLLPRRSSKPLGVDSFPYRIDRAESIEGGGSRLHGRLWDVVRNRVVEQTWTLSFHERRGKVVVKKKHGPRRTIGDLGRGFTPSPVRIDPDMLRQYELRKLAKESGHDIEVGEPPKGTSPLPKIVVGRELTDVNGDGAEDLVVLTCDFAAHVFPGKRDEHGRLTLGDELPAAPPLYIDDARYVLYWDEEEIEDSPEYFMEVLRVNVMRTPGEDVPLSVGLSHADVHVRYRWKDGALVPHVRILHNLDTRPLRNDTNARYRPKKKTLFTSHWEEHLASDVTGDGAQEFAKICILTREPYGDLAFGDGLGTESKLATAFLWAGEPLSTTAAERRELRYPAQTIAFPDPVEIPENLHLGMPIELHWVPVRDGTERRRACILYRPWNVALFLEGVDHNR